MPGPTRRESLAPCVCHRSSLVQRNNLFSRSSVCILFFANSLCIHTIRHGKGGFVCPARLFLSPWHHVCQRSSLTHYNSCFDLSVCILFMLILCVIHTNRHGKGGFKCPARLLSSPWRHVVVIGVPCVV